VAVPCPADTPSNLDKARSTGGARLNNKLRRRRMRIRTPTNLLFDVVATPGRAAVHAHGGLAGLAGLAGRCDRRIYGVGGGGSVPGPILVCGQIPEPGPEIGASKQCVPNIQEEAERELGKIIGVGRHCAGVGSAARHPLWTTGAQPRRHSLARNPDIQPIERRLHDAGRLPDLRMSPMSGGASAVPCAGRWPP